MGAFPSKSVREKNPLKFNGPFHLIEAYMDDRFFESDWSVTQADSFQEFLMKADWYDYAQRPYFDALIRWRAKNLSTAWVMENIVEDIPILSPQITGHLLSFVPVTQSLWKSSSSDF